MQDNVEHEKPVCTESFWLHLYTCYEYKQNPLVFVVLPEELTSEQKCNILMLADEFYADTCQETTDWALEYQLWARMLICNGQLSSIPVNTSAHHLALENNCIERICNVLGPDSKNAVTYRICAENKEMHVLICDLYAKDPDCSEGFDVAMKNCNHIEQIQNIFIAELKKEKTE